MHRRKDLWGPDGEHMTGLGWHHLTFSLLVAELFDPDRFLDERLHKYLTPNPFIFLPFNAGPRICLGQQVRPDPRVCVCAWLTTTNQFAYHEMSYFLIRLLQSIDAVSLDMDMQTLPPADWAQAKGRKALEKVQLRSHLTLYVMVRIFVFVFYC